MQFLHSVDGLYSLVCFCSGWYWFFLSTFSAPFRSSRKAGLVVTKSLSICLSVKDFISSSVMKLRLDMKFLVENSLRMLNIGPHSLLAFRVSADRSAVSLMGFPFSLSALNIFSCISTWWIWWLCVLGFIFSKNIFVVFSVFPECWPVLLHRESSAG